MGSLVVHVVTTLIGEYLPKDWQLLFMFGWAIAFALWCLDYAARDRRLRPVASLLLLLIAGGLAVVVLVLPTWSVGQLLGICACGLLIYLPLGVRTARGRKRVR